VRGTLFALFLCWSISGHAVSRVGGGKIQSHTSGFELTVPAPFDDLQTYQQGIVARGPSTISPQLGMIRQFIEISEFSGEFKDAVLLSKSELVDRMSKSKWLEVPASISCAVELRLGSGNVAASLVTWGQGRGFVIKGPRSPQVERTIQAILKSVKTIHGACTWQ